jgi:hypothetical protein
MLWARTLERMALSQEMHQSCWVHPRRLQLVDSDWDLDLRNTETPLCMQCGLGGPTLMVVSFLYGVSFVGNVVHTQPCTTFPVDYLQECSSPVPKIPKLNHVDFPDHQAIHIQDKSIR